MIGRGDRSSAPQVAAASAGGAVGTGLMVLGAVVGGLIALWLLVNLVDGKLAAGGLVLGLVLVALLSLPLVGAGWYLRSRGTVEQQEADTFMARRAVLDNDRVVRRELARELEQRVAALLREATALSPAAAVTVRGAAERLREVAQDIRRPGYDATTWLEQTAARLDGRQIERLRRYDGLVLEEARRLESLTRDLDTDPQAVQRLSEAVDLLAGHVREREALLGRGEANTGLSPQELLSAGAAPRRRLVTPLELRLEDAVSYELDDYVVRGILTYFAGERDWHVYQLHDGKQERWLEVRAQGADVTWYELRPPADVPDGEAVTLDGADFSVQDAGSAAVDVETAAGRRAGVFVEYRRYRGTDGRRLSVERWPDGQRILLGKGILSDELDLWTRPPPTE